MLRRRQALLCLTLFVSLLSGCSRTSSPQDSVELNAIRDAKAVSISVAQALAVDSQSEGITLSAQATLDTYTITAVDFYGSPLVYINITAPEEIKDPWSFAATLDGKEWPYATPSNWGITITGATELSVPVSLIETGLGSLRDFYKTVQKMGGPGQIKRIVAALSTEFLLEDKSGAYWDPTTQTRLDAKVLEYVKKRYDDLLQEILGNLPVASKQAALAWSRSGPNLKMVEAATESDGTLDLKAYLSRLGPQATYPYTGSFYNPELGPNSLIGYTGYGQSPFYFKRPSSHDWMIWNCDGVGGNLRTKAIGCGPASFGAMVMYHYKYRNVPINGVRYDSRTPVWSMERMLHHISAPVPSHHNKPYLAYVMGSCVFMNGTATAANGYEGGMKRFITEQRTGLSAGFSWGRGLAIPGGVNARFNILQAVKARNIPAVVEYPAGGGTIHYSFVKSWRAGSPNHDLFAQPENH